MFGFPTRVRLLYEKEPKKLPATDVVDRNIDIAISSFAPGCEIVKDKRVLTSVGFVSYDIRYGGVDEKEGLNALEKEVWMCAQCGFTTVSEQDDFFCSICGGSIRRVKACSPLGFCTDYEAEIKDFNGRFDWIPFSTSISLDGETKLDNPNKVENLLLNNNKLPKEGLVHQINTNEGKLFKIGKLAGTKRYCARDAFNDNKKETLRIFEEEDYALIASKTTGILTAGIFSVNSDMDLNPLLDNSRGHAIRASFISWGFILRKSICDHLDIESSELDVGFHVNKEKKGELFFVEKLENGAGYCNYLNDKSQPNIPRLVLIDPLQKDGNIYSLLKDEKHIKNCSSSCYDCLRDYYNQQYHSILDWRLGLDLARVSFDNEFVADFTSEYWVLHIYELVTQLAFRKKGKRQEIDNGINIIKCGSEIYLITHPFWSDKYIQKLRKSIGYDFVEMNVFDAIREIKK